jgi:phage terminase small subunit
MTELTLRQTRFVDEYVVSGNAAAAARAAGYAPNAAKVTACRMLTRANLQAAIEAKRRAAAEQFELSSVPTFSRWCRITS